MENKETLGKTAKTVIKCLAAAAIILPYRVKIVYTAPDKKEIEKASIKALVWSVNYDKNRADGEKPKTLSAFWLECFSRTLQAFVSINRKRKTPQDLQVKKNYGK